MSIQPIIWHFKQLSSFNDDEFQEVFTTRDYVFGRNGEKDLRKEPIEKIDEYCYHSFAWDSNGIVAYCRVLQECNDLYRIERVLVHKRHRRKGYGQQLISQTCDKIKELFDGKKATLSAFSYVTDMYKKVGFTQIGEEFDMNGIPSIEMVKLL
ncbi:N-acetyltransferase domain-containing protein [Entamoeba marina]